ncbi:LysR substrate-binding domain-containing protein [Streptomyces sp. NPDC057021]|uniref:LysR substrate-binding domain-containing protein n=1 Tax=unclassified Streptomyces TaxID=2593676 RepID=UPI0009A0F5EF|nr:LysR substrate-binding domain-containing protein [Streptomyces sp. CB02009]
MSAEIRPRLVPRDAPGPGVEGVVQGLVAAGTGVALIPRLALGAPRPDLVVRPLAGPVLAREISVAVLRSASNRAAQELVSALREQAALVAERWAG